MAEDELDDAQQIKLVVVGDGMCNHDPFRRPTIANSNLCVIMRYTSATGK